MSAASHFLALLDDQDRRDLESLATTVRFARGKALLAQGQVADKVVILRSGRVKVVVTTPSGRESLLGFRGPGAFLGEQALVDGRPRAAGVFAVEPVEALVVAASAFRAFLERRPAIALAMLALLSERLRDSDRRLAQFAAADTTGRVAGRLVELCEEHGEPGDDDTVTITLPLSQAELADWSGSSLEATAKALRTLREAGWITTGRRALVVHRVEELRARAA